MLLNTYGKLRQADKAWAIYQQLLNQQGQQSGDSRQQALHAREAQLPPDAATEPAGVDVAATAAQGGATPTAAGDDGAAAGGGAGGGAAWQARLAQRQARLAAEAERLVRELALGAFPLSDYAYSTIITALSRVRCGAVVAIIAQCTMVQAQSFSKGRVAVRSQAGKGISLCDSTEQHRDVACAWTGQAARPSLCQTVWAARSLARTLAGGLAHNTPAQPAPPLRRVQPQAAWLPQAGAAPAAHPEQRTFSPAVPAACRLAAGSQNDRCAVLHPSARHPSLAPSGPRFHAQAQRPL